MNAFLSFIVTSGNQWVLDPSFLLNLIWIQKLITVHLFLFVWLIARNLEKICEITCSQLDFVILWARSSVISLCALLNFFYDFNSTQWKATNSYFFPLTFITVDNFSNRASKHDSFEKNVKMFFFCKINHFYILLKKKIVSKIPSVIFLLVLI